MWHGGNRYFALPKTHAGEPEPAGEGPFGLAPQKVGQKLWDWTGGDHPGVAFYWILATILGIITLAEYWVFTFDWTKTSINLTLFALSGIKFFSVVAFFMHLKFDNKLFAKIFGFGFLLAMFVFLALLALFFKLNG